MSLYDLQKKIQERKKTYGVPKILPQDYIAFQEIDLIEKIFAKEIKKIEFRLSELEKDYKIETDTEQGWDFESRIAELRGVLGK